MYRSAETFVRSLVLLALFLLLSPSGLYAEDKGQEASSREGLQQRIDFGNAHILGQSIKSGAVYLMHRKKSDIKNMLEVRQHYRDEIKEDFGLDKTALIQSAAEPDKDPKK